MSCVIVSAVAEDSCHQGVQRWSWGFEPLCPSDFNPSLLANQSSQSHPWQPGCVCAATCPPCPAGALLPSALPSTWAAIPDGLSRQQGLHLPCVWLQHIVNTTRTELIIFLICMWHECAWVMYSTLYINHVYTFSPNHVCCSISK